MQTLEIKGKDLELKCNIKFAKKAKAIADEDRKKGDAEQDGFFTLYMRLMNKDAEAVIPFWKAALAHNKNLPSDGELEMHLEDILEERIETDNDSEPVIKECFDLLDSAGFFSGKRRTFWNRTSKQKDKLKEAKEDETAEQQEKREEQLNEIEELEEAYKEIKEVETAENS